MGNDIARGLTDRFLKDLRSPNGCLSWVLERVKGDRTLCLEIRGGYVNVYYRGGSLFKISENGSSPRSYSIAFDRKYLNGREDVVPTEPCNLTEWGQAIPRLKDCMDLWFGKYPKTEREFQQLVVRDNNFPEENATDYFICDIEYDNRSGARFDLLGVRWPSTARDRKNPDGLRLAFIEMKTGDGSLTGLAGLSKHMADIVAFLGQAGSLDQLKHEMMTVFNQKIDLGIIGCGKKIRSFEEHPEVLLLLANHDPAKSALKNELRECDPHASRLEEMGVSIRFVRASYCGYGIYEDCILEWRDAKGERQ